MPSAAKHTDIIFLRSNRCRRHDGLSLAYPPPLCPLLQTLWRKSNAVANFDRVACDRCFEHVCRARRGGPTGRSWAKAERRGLATGHESGVSRHGGSRQSGCQRAIRRRPSKHWPISFAIARNLTIIVRSRSVKHQRQFGCRRSSPAPVTVGGIPYTFPEAVDWYFNPTTAPDSKHPRDYEWQWQLNRHREFDVFSACLSSHRR